MAHASGLWQVEGLPHYGVCQPASDYHPSLTDVAQASLHITIQASLQQPANWLGRCRRELAEIDLGPQHIGQRMRDGLAAVE